jgi:hypothetical protein
MNFYIDEYKKPAQNFHRIAKIELLKNLSAYMADFKEVLDFTILEMETELA